MMNEIKWEDESKNSGRRLPTSLTTLWLLEAQPAGNIADLGTELYSEHPFWNWCSRNFDQTIVVPGNHELYRGFDINELCEGRHASPKFLISTLNNPSVCIGKFGSLMVFI